SGAAGAGGARAGSARGTRATGAGGARAGGAGGARAGGAGGIGAAGAGGSGAAGAGATGPAGAGGVGGSGAGGTRVSRSFVVGDSVALFHITVTRLLGAGGVGAGGAGGAGAADVIATVIATAPPSPYPAQTGSLAEHHELESRPASPICTLNRARRSRPPPVPGTHASNLARDASPTVTRLLATIVTGPSLESTSAFSLVIELVNFVATRRLDYVASLVTESESVCPPSVGDELALGCDVLEDRQFELECLAAVLPHFASMVLCPEGDLDAMDIPTPRSYAEAIIGEYSPQWQTSIDEEMAS
ncbi:unnamed protein product, partial [Closterium sp. NIES-53]